jgi:hypothetical protein
MHIQFLVNRPVMTDRSSCLSLLNQDEAVVLSSPGSDLDPAGISPGNLKQLAAGFGESISPDHGAWGVRFPFTTFRGYSRALL